MRLVITLLSLTVTLTALVALNGALIGGVAEASEPLGHPVVARAAGRCGGDGAAGIACVRRWFGSCRRRRK